MSKSLQEVIVKSKIFHQNLHFSPNLAHLPYDSEDFHNSLEKLLKIDSRGMFTSGFKKQTNVKDKYFENEWNFAHFLNLQEIYSIIKSLLGMHCSPNYFQNLYKCVFVQLLILLILL